jgi:hypothetical protein
LRIETSAEPFALPPLIASEPLEAFRNSVRSELAALKRWAPSSDVAQTLERFVSRYELALTESRTTRAIMTVDEAHAVFGRPRSTISYLCRTKGDEVGARKIDGVWQIVTSRMAAYFGITLT